MIGDYFPTLKDLSLKVFSDHLKTHKYKRNQEFAFKDYVFLPEKLSEKLITILSVNGILNSQTLKLFSSQHTRLKILKIPDASHVSNTDLQVFKKHKLKEIQINRLRASVNELIDCLDQWTLDNLEKFNISYTSLSSAPSKSITSISLLRNVRELDVSFTNINDHYLGVIVEDLPKLEALNISYTSINDISHLYKCRNRLKTLIMANVELLQPKDNNSDTDIDLQMNVLVDLGELRHLDISFEKDTSPFSIVTGNEPWHNFQIMSLVDKLPHLISLDVSGMEHLKEENVIEFLRNHIHLKFLGLVNTGLCSCDIFLNPTNTEYRSDLKIAGIGSLDQVILSLKLYEKRINFMQNSLYSLYTLSNRTEFGPRPDLIKLLTNVMRIHVNVFSIQLACSACLYNLTKSGWLDNDPFGIPSTLMSEVAQLILDAMEYFPKHYQLQKNALLTLCNDRIIQNTNMDRFRCAKLVLNALCYFNSETIERLCVAISSIVAAKISAEQMTEIGSHKPYMKKLLVMVKRKLDNFAADSTLGFTLSTLWNVTDESFGTCETFLKEGGLRLFTEMLTEYSDCDTVLTKILGLLNNIAEFYELRHWLMTEEVINPIRNLLASDSIEISYFSAGVLAHLVSTGVDGWTIEKISRQSVLEELEEAILRWKQIDGEMVAYRSFRPFIPLLNCYETYQAQLWALWAMQHVLTVNAPRYCRMLREEKVCDIFVTLSCREDTNPHVQHRARCIFNQLSDYRKKKISSFQF